MIYLSCLRNMTYLRNYKRRNRNFKNTKVTKSHSILSLNHKVIVTCFCEKNVSHIYFATFDKIHILEPYISLDKLNQNSMITIIKTFYVSSFNQHSTLHMYHLIHKHARFKLSKFIPTILLSMKPFHDKTTKIHNTTTHIGLSLLVSHCGISIHNLI